MRHPLETEIGLFKENANVISFLYPAQNKPLIEKMAEKKLTAFGILNHCYWGIWIFLSII